VRASGAITSRVPGSGVVTSVRASGAVTSTVRASSRPHHASSSIKSGAHPHPSSTRTVSRRPGQGASTIEVSSADRVSRYTGTDGAHTVTVTRTVTASGEHGAASSTALPSGAITTRVAGPRINEAGNARPTTTVWSGANTGYSSGPIDPSTFVPSGTGNTGFSSGPVDPSTDISSGEANTGFSSGPVVSSTYIASGTANTGFSSGPVDPATHISSGEAITYTFEGPRSTVVASKPPRFTRSSRLAIATPVAELA
jgi:hypothetical protein